MVDCQRSQGEFAGWTRTETDYFCHQLGAVIIDSGVAGYGFASSRKDWDDLIVGDARAVLPLVTCLNKTYGCEEWETDVIAEALTCVLETTVASITPEDLRLIAHCDDLPVLSFDGKELVYGSFSCIHIRQLARQELTRRGMGAEDDHAHG